MFKVKWILTSRVIFDKYSICKHNNWDGMWIEFLRKRNGRACIKIHNYVMTASWEMGCCVKNTLDLPRTVFHLLSPDCPSKKYKHVAASSCPATGWIFLVQTTSFANWKCATLAICLINILAVPPSEAWLGDKLAWQYAQGCLGYGLHVRSNAVHHKDSRPTSVWKRHNLVLLRGVIHSLSAFSIYQECSWSKTSPALDRLYAMWSFSM